MDQVVSRPARRAESGKGWRFVVPAAEGAVARGVVPSFSVVIAAYNVARFLGEAVGSALAQTVAPLEVIVVDDGSTDDVEGALAPFGDRVRLLRQANGGEAAAKNAGARVASGEFVAFFDGDDVQAPERLEAMGALAAERPDLDILTTRAHMVQDDRVLMLYPADGVFGVADQRREVFEREFLPSPAIRRRRLLALGGFDERLSHNTDVDCLIRLVLDGARAGMVDAPLFSYRRRPGQLTADEVTDKRKRLEMLGRLGQRDDLDAGDRAAIARAVHGTNLLLARAMVRAGERGARSASWRVARDRGYPLDTRLKAALAAVAPALARRTGPGLRRVLVAVQELPPRTMNAPGLRRILRPVWRRAVERDLRRLHDVLEQTPMAGRYWIFGGLLLGWAREGRILDHDLDDIDLAYRATDRDALEAAVPALLAAGFRSWGALRNLEGEVTQHVFARGYTRYELFALFPHGDRLRDFGYGTDPETGREIEFVGEFPDQDLVPFEFLGRTWLKHADHEAELATLYGPGWRVPDRGWSYLHAPNIVERRMR